MNHKEKLLEIYESSFSIEDIHLPNRISANILTIGNSIQSQKGVYTVLITLGVHKLLHPNQDIRNHQDSMSGGFSGRSIDTKYITPTLKELGLTSMAESGWLTRSLEQPYPYNLNYNGKISKLKNEFLSIVDTMQNKPIYIESILRMILNRSILIREENRIELKPIDDPDAITIDLIVVTLQDFMTENYTISGGSKLPVIAFYSIYEILVNELKRFEGCNLGVLGSHTASDRTSKSSGDVEIFKNKKTLEAIEIKFDIEIDAHIVNRVIGKIIQYNPKRYYILSTAGIKTEEYGEIIEKVAKLKEEHCCQLIINGLIPTLKYYLRLIENLNEFIDRFTLNIINDKELKVEHKRKWKEIYERNF